MVVRTDDGRQVAFDIKDYAHIDHGFAATFHKAQGLTIDEAYVLATPGMDRHSTYVGLTRHRDSVQLYYGCDDFADQGKLIRTLSRERAKDMASDYATDGHDDPIRAFAARREFNLPERAHEMVAHVQEKAQAMFDGFKPKDRGVVAPEPDIAARDAIVLNIRRLMEIAGTAPHKVEAIVQKRLEDLNASIVRGETITPPSPAYVARIEQNHSEMHATANIVARDAILLNAKRLMDIAGTEPAKAEAIVSDRLNSLNASMARGETLTPPSPDYTVKIAHAHAVTMATRVKPELSVERAPSPDDDIGFGY
jgi:hypothetical protein